eukprot:4334467-Ditylum_brightwellii.AAC.2
MIQWTQDAAGLGFSFLKDTRDIPHLEGTWLKNFRNGLHTIGRTIELEHDWIRPPIQQHDKHVMQLFLESSAIDHK